MMRVYAEYGAIGVVCSLFAYMIMNLIKSQKDQSDELDQVRQAIAIMESTIENVEGNVIKQIDRFNRR